MGRVHVNEQTGNDYNPGSPDLPFRSIGAAVSSPANNEIFIEDGIYSELIDSVIFDSVRRKLIGFGDVYLAAQGNPSSFKGRLSKNHLFKNIKFVNYSHHALELGGGTTTLSACFFKPFQRAGSMAIFINPPINSSVCSLDIKKCTFINNEITLNINPLLSWNVINIKNIINSLFFGHTFHIRKGGEPKLFSSFLSVNNDKGNYYDDNPHLANGGINSTAGENPPLFVNPADGDYDLLPTSTLVGAGYLGSDIGSFHEFSPIGLADEPFSIFDAGWQNDNRYYNVFNNTIGPDGPPDSAPIIQMTIADAPRWVLDLGRNPLGKSGRLLSPVIDMRIARLITRSSWSAEEDRTPLLGSKLVLNNSNIAVPDLEIRGSLFPFGFEDNPSPAWATFNRSTTINLQAKYVQYRIIFRLDGNG